MPGVTDFVDGFCLGRHYFFIFVVYSGCCIMLAQILSGTLLAIFYFKLRIVTVLILLIVA